MILFFFWLATICPGGLLVAGAALAHDPGAGFFCDLWGLVVFGCPLWWAYKFARRTLREP